MLDDLLLGNYKTVAARLGLTIEGSFKEGHLRIHGTFDGFPVEMWFGPHATHTKAQLPAPAPLDLSIVTTSLFQKLAHLFTNHTTLGDPAFDKTFSVKCEDLPRLAALLDAGARSALHELADERLHPQVDRQSVHLRRFSNGGSDSEKVIERDFQEAARLARAIAASFAKAS